MLKRKWTEMLKQAEKIRRKMMVLRSRRKFPGEARRNLYKDRCDQFSFLYCYCFNKNLNVEILGFIAVSPFLLLSLEVELNSPQERMLTKLPDPDCFLKAFYCNKNTRID